MTRLEVGLSPPLLLDNLSSRSEDLVVDEHHDGQREVEGSYGRVDLVAEVLTDVALTLAVDVPQDEKRWEANAGGTKPHQGDTANHTLRSPLYSVFQGFGDRVVPVT